jgi:choline kinase
MAIQNIKEIINNRGYVINPDDRKIFEEGDLQSFFGFSENDAIEFVIYDVNSNQLPQADGNFVKYIPLTNDNINDYFLVPNGTIFQKYQLPKEYFIDIERLMGEAGYTNGIFRTQITLINKRAGSDKQFDKLWIQEISPSRTEVRLFPLKEGVTLNPELKTRYDAFVNDREFREDTIAYVIEFIENIKPTEISTFLRSKYKKAWLDNLVNEFKIQNFELFVNTIYEKFVQSCIYEFTNRISDLTNLNYGKPKSTKPSVVLSKELVISLCKKILTETINYYLPRQDNRTQTNTLATFEASLDEISNILQRSESDTIYNAKLVEQSFTQVSASPANETQFTLDTLIKQTGANTNSVLTADDEAKYTPTDPPTETSTNTSGGGTGAQTTTTGEGQAEDTRGQTGQFNYGLANGPRGPRVGIQ